jgi:putative ATP-binding cassette transporter
MVALAIVAGIISGAASAALIALINRALSSDSPPAAYRFLWAFVGLMLLLPLARFCSQWVLTKLSQKVVYEVRARLSRQILNAPLRRLEEVGPGRVLSSLTEDVYNIAITILNVPMLFMHLTLVIGSLAYLAWLSWTALVAVLVFMAVGVASFQLAVRMARPYLQGARRDGDQLMGHFRALNDGAKELRLNTRRRETFLSKVVHETSMSLHDNNVTSNVILAAGNSWFNLVFFALIGLVIFGLPRVQALDMNVLTGYTLTIFYMLVPFETLTGIIPSLSRADISLKRIESLGISLIEDVAEAPAPGASPEKPSWRSLELEGVTHTYRHEMDNSSFTLGPVDLGFRPGELTFIVGGNGSGKTTLVKLLTGLYLPESGRILFDGAPVTDENRDVYRQNFSAVFSDFFLFESLLGLEHTELDARAREYLLQLQLEHKVKVQDGRLSTIDLSQGQRKRLALLTAFLEDRPIYVFDEWAADQDPHFRDIFYLHILPELKARGKTVLVISHDDRYYHLGDRLIKLDYGQVESDRRAEGGEPIPPARRAARAESPAPARP